MQFDLFNLNNRSMLHEITLPNTPIEEISLPTRAYNVLKSNKLETIKDIIEFGPDNIIKLRNAGKKTVRAISKAIKPYIPEYTRLHKKGNSDTTFEEMVSGSYDEKLLNTSIEELNLSIRAFNALKNAGLRTIKDIINFKVNALRKMKNVGRKTIDNIKNAILEIPAKATQEIKENLFVDTIENLLSSITSKYLHIIKARYGYEDGKCKTLEEIGNEMGITRERVRQIIGKEIRLLKLFKKREGVQALIEDIERLLLQYNGIIGIKDIAGDKYFASGTRNQLIFLMNFIQDFYTDRYRIIDNHFLTSLNDYEIENLQSKIQEAALKCQFPIEEKTFIKNIISSIGPLSEDYLIYQLFHKEHIEISKGKVLSLGKLSIPQRLKLLMKDIDIPMHFTEIAKLYRNHFGYTKNKASDFERAIHARISDSKDFIIVDPGTYILRGKFKVPDNIKEIVDISKRILSSSKSISDTRYIISELKKQNIDIGNLNVYSLKSILLEYPDFISYRKFEIGIEKSIDGHKRKSLSDLIFEILSSAIKPLHMKTILKEILKGSEFPKYTITQRLDDDPRFIKVAPATYTVAKNIDQYEEKCKIIIDFTKEWIQLKGDAISAFFVSEVLKETGKVKDLSLGLVEHALAISPEFVKLANRFYNLARK